MVAIPWWSPTTRRDSNEVDADTLEHNGNCIRANDRNEGSHARYTDQDLFESRADNHTSVSRALVGNGWARTGVANKCPVGQWRLGSDRTPGRITDRCSPCAERLGCRDDDHSFRRKTVRL